MAFTTQSLAKARDYAEKMKARMDNIRKTAVKGISNGFQLSEVGGTAFAFGYANGRWGKDGEIKVLGVSADLTFGAATAAVAMFGGLGDAYREHGVNVASGALAAYAYRVAHQLGANAARNDAQPNAGPVIQRPSLNAPVQVGWEGSPQGYAYTVHEQQQG